MTHLILASASLRRQQLLTQIGVAFDVRVADIDETPRQQEVPYDFVKRMSLEKAQTVFQASNKISPVLGADTIVVCDGDIFGKPKNEQDAVRMLLRLSGCTHQVMTAVAVVSHQYVHCVVNITNVTFGDITQTQAHTYWQTGEPYDKAGAYAIQGVAAVWIAHIEGSFSGVMGLPLYETAQLLAKCGIPTGLMHE